MKRLLLVTLFLTVGCQQQPDPLIRMHIPLPEAKLADRELLVPYGNNDPGTISHRFVVLLYLSNIGCDACGNEALFQFVELARKYDQYFDFLIVGFGQHDAYLDQMIRVHRISYPILLETHEGSLGLTFGESATLALYDFQQSEITSGYHPKPLGLSDDAYEAFEDLLSTRMTEFNRAGR